MPNANFVCYRLYGEQCRVLEWYGPKQNGARQYMSMRKALCSNIVVFLILRYISLTIKALHKFLRNSIMNILANVNTSETRNVKYILEILLIEIYEIYLELGLKFEDRVI